MHKLTATTCWMVLHTASWCITYYNWVSIQPSLRKTRNLYNKNPYDKSGRLILIGCQFQLTLGFFWEHMRSWTMTLNATPRITLESLSFTLSLPPNLTKGIFQVHQNFWLYSHLLCSLQYNHLEILLMEKKSCTTWDVWNPVTSGINYLSIGAGFLPSTVSRNVFPEPKKKVEIHHESHLTGSWIVMLWMKPHSLKWRNVSQRKNKWNLQLVFKKNQAL